MDYICKDVSSKQTNKIQSLAALDQAKVWLVCMEVKGKGAGLGFKTGGERFGQRLMLIWDSTGLPQTGLRLSWAWVWIRLGIDEIQGYGRDMGLQDRFGWLVLGLFEVMRERK